MARRLITAALLVVAACGAAVATTGPPCSGGVCVEVEGEAASSVGVELLQRATRRSNEKQIPGLSGIIDAASGAINNVSDAVSKQVGSIVSNVTDTLSDQVSSATGSLTSAAANTVASALNKTILVLGSQADELYDTCESLRDSILDKMNKAKADAYARLDVLEDQVDGAIGRVLPLWDNISAAVVTTSGVATAVLTSVGQPEIAEKLNTSLSSVLEQAGSFAESLQNVSAIMDSIRNATEEELSQGLARVQKTLQTGLQKADDFATHLNAAFGELTDEASVKIAAAIPGVDPAPIDEAFDSVDAAVKQAADELINGPRQLVNGLSEAVGMVEQELPDHKSSAHPAVSSVGLPLLGGLLLAAAA